MASVGGFFRGVWRGLDVLRRVLHLLLLLLIFGFIVGALQGSLPNLPPRAALLIQPQGQIVEQRSGDPITIAFNQARGLGNTQTLLWDLTESIRAAANDSRVQAILLQLDYLGGAGQPTLEEVAAAMGDFRASGKKIIAWSTSYTQGQYYLAAHADEIYLDPMGEVLIDGYERYRMYYKGLLDKLAVDVHLFRVGEFKSAAEDLVRTTMSAEDRADSLVYLQALWEGYKAAVAQARGIGPEVIDQYANGYIDALRNNGGDAARVALEAGLVNGLKTHDEINARMVELVGSQREGNAYNVITYGDYLSVHHAEKRLHKLDSGRVGVVIASGEILDGDQPPGAVGGLTAAGLLRKARDNEEIAAVVLRVDSPGGSVLASEQIYREVAAIRAAGKPVVVSMGDVAASGGYYIAAPANRIMASPTTITGSIGIYAAVPTVDRTLNKLGVAVDGIGTTAMSGKLRVDRALDPALRDYVQLSIEHGYEIFLGHVAAGRGKSREEVDAIARGRVWVGSTALENGLVDELGSYQDALNAAASLAGLPEDFDVQRLEPQLSWAEQLALQLRIGGARLSAMLVGPAVDSFARQLAPLASLQEEFSRFERLTASGRPQAYCLCAAE